VVHVQACLLPFNELSYRGIRTFASRERTIVATHYNRIKLFEKAARLIVIWLRGTTTMVTNRFFHSQSHQGKLYEFNVARYCYGGSTNTVLHLLAIAQEAGVNFTMRDIDELSRKIPNICKVAPSSQYHIQDVNRAGGILGIMAELEPLT